MGVFRGFHMIEVLEKGGLQGFRGEKCIKGAGIIRCTLCDPRLFPRRKRQSGERSQIRVGKGDEKVGSYEMKISIQTETGRGIKVKREGGRNQLTAVESGFQNSAERR